ncbi:hypothetical protein TWF696_000494 [Orbilia brochopaga]|uniref:Uncharacterized protein n=1 Tax=Orbilia brochopaga TaxID=3140254 RepID=A0AAV9VBU7_9PEZI
MARYLFASRTTTVLTLLAPPALYMSATFARLLYQYPASSIHASHPIFLTEDSARYKQLDAHWFTTRITLRYLRPRSLDATRDARTPVEVWTAAFFSTPTFSLEARGCGWLLGRGFTTGDQARGGVYVGQRLAHGLFRIVSMDKDGGEGKGGAEGELSREDQRQRLLGRVIISFWIPDGMVHVWEVAAARYGLPWRLLSGGRHCFEILEDETGSLREGRGEKEEEEYVTVRMGCVADLERVNRVDGREDGKGLAGWALWLHEMYARWLVDAAVRKLKRDW